MYIELIKHMNKKIVDVRMKNRLNEYIKEILEKNATIKIYPHITLKKNNQELILKKQKNHITYIYKNGNYKEKYQIFKIGKEYISELKTDNVKKISVFQEELEIIKHIEEPEEETTYIRTNNNNILLIEKTENNKKYYIGLNENRYENYIPEHTIFTEIEESDYINLISEKVKEEVILKKYNIEEKKLHLH